jgi:hypothetical protein
LISKVIHTDRTCLNLVEDEVAPLDVRQPFLLAHHGSIRIRKRELVGKNLIKRAYIGFAKRAIQGRHLSAYGLLVQPLLHTIHPFRPDLTAEKQG